LDSSVLIAAHRGRSPERESALKIINDSSRGFIVSPFLYLEAIPKAVHSKRTAEIIFYRTYFDKAFRWVNDVESIVRIAQQESERHGLAAMDALHVAAVHLGEAEILFTLERKTKPMHRATLVRVAYLESVI
jgi:predicted nucleic acid-binding protein